MTEQKRIASLFDKLYDGSPWLGVNLMDTLGDISAEKASKRPLTGRNTIWEIVNHIIAWRKNVLRRVLGEVIQTPEHNYIEPVTDTSAEAWQNTLNNLAQSQKQWLAFLKDMPTEDFEKVYPKNKMSYYEHLHGILQHDAYHLGQIVILAKMA